MGKNARSRIESLLAEVDITIGGSRPWDLELHNEDLFSRIFAEGALGLGEAYMEGWWDCSRLDELFYRVLLAGVDRKIRPWRDLPHIARAKLSNLQNLLRASEVGRRHYDAGNDLYACMLDKRMIYSCGYWKDAHTLDEAQEAKLELVCAKLRLEPGMRVLDVGCGWGGMAKFATERYRVTVTGVTLSREQAKFARELCRGLPVEILFQDYRAIDGLYDRVLSLGMFEHVGVKNYRNFMQIARDHLADDGLFLLQTVGGNESVTHLNPWLSKYIFPNSMVPSVSQIGTAVEGLFVMEDWHNFGADYDKTIMAWHNNFERHWEKLKSKYDSVFRRMWRFYLLSCAGYLRARRRNLWQIVFSPNGVTGGYRAPR